MAESTHSSHSVMDKLKDKLTHRGVHKDTARHTDTLDEAEERPTREDFISTGRGGAGNIVSPSRDRGAASMASREAALERSVSRSRERARERSESRVRIGRGGAGNFRSPSREPMTMEQREAERRAREHEIEKEANTFQASGRGGAGNMTRRQPDFDTSAGAVPAGDEPNEPRGRVP